MEPRVAGQLRMERGDEEAPLAREHRMAVELGEHLDPRADLLDPRRPDEDRRAAARPRPASSRSVSNDATWRPKALRRTAMSTSPRWSRSSTIIPAQVPKTGPVEAADRLVEPVEPHQPRERGRLAARDDEPVEARRAARACAPRPPRRRAARSIAACSRKFPCTARTPIAERLHRRQW